MNTSLPEGDESGIRTVPTTQIPSRRRNGWLSLVLGIVVLLVLYAVLSAVGLYHVDSSQMNYCDGASYNCAAGR